ncbi:hypothetical protein THASP1DRAFT_30263 [Thamnocephalis sphaerospora]|uniref:Uncharacterized protein n=1 Tax=Thamnocephalis sphaerospora TaxID=78915 RepID=A0A4P9XPK7_9FUNG|nr:hypothetical protein THASP1DRAFT_30263 [Thamnocephalis sphaerospora]|eukprot:RKP07926.1 hypothetical protein THASP1DRAFT_30263 [Thamnocephalis sphaerospora]
MSRAATLARQSSASATLAPASAAAIGNTLLSDMTTATRHPDLRDADHQVRKGIELIQDAYERRTAELYNELTRYKQEFVAQRQQAQQLQIELNRTARLLTESERALANEKAERRTLQTSKAKLEENHMKLRKWAIQLEGFRKSIVNMVEYSPSVPVNMTELEQSYSEAMAAGIDDNLEAGSPLDPYHIATSALPEELLRTSTFESGDEPLYTASENNGIAEKPGNTRTRANAFETPALPNRRAAPITMSATSATRQPDLATRLKDGVTASARKPAAKPAAYPTPSTAGRTAPLRATPAMPGTPRMADETTAAVSAAGRRTPRSSAKFTSNPRGNSGSGGNSASRTSSSARQRSGPRMAEGDPEMLEDAGLVYRRIRDQLSPSDFESFAHAVSAFNAGDRTAVETMREVERLVPDRQLVQGMRRLVMSAVQRAEASDEYEDELEQQQLRADTPARRRPQHFGTASFGDDINGADEEEDDGTFRTPSDGTDTDGALFRER